MGVKQAASSIPIIGGLFDDSADKAMDQLRNNQGLWDGLEVPGAETYTPEELQYLADFNPEDAQFDLVEENGVRTAAQDAALERLASLADSGLSDADKLGFEDARSNAASMARGSREAVISNMNARGLGGSGMDYAIQEIGNQEAAERARKSSMETAATAAQQRALYQKAYLDAIGGARDQDYRAEANNSDIINDFNKSNTAARNTAQAGNLTNRQNIVNSNVEGRNEAQRVNQGNRQTAFGNKVTKLNGLTGANAQVAQGYAAENAANTAARNANTKLAADLYTGGASSAAGGTDLIDPKKKKIETVGGSYGDMGSIA